MFDKCEIISISASECPAWLEAALEQVPEITL
jgi:hypothetical protein